MLHCLQIAMFADACFGSRLCIWKVRCNSVVREEECPFVAKKEVKEWREIQTSVTHGPGVNGGDFGMCCEI